MGEEIELLNEMKEQLSDKKEKVAELRGQKQSLMEQLKA